MTADAVKIFVVVASLALSANIEALAESLQKEAADAPTLDCTYNSRAHHDTATFKRCAWIDRDGHLHVTPWHLRHLTYDNHRLATIHVDQWYYVRRTGRLAPVMALDNWAEPFSDGLARSPVGKKIGYVDRELKLVIPARYDGAFRFEQGVAVVCTGCEIVSSGEHTRYEGGMWGCIDRHGRELRPFRPLLPNEHNDAVCSRAQP
jgi:WG repeat protein